jgi:hypothetical protein
MNNRGKKQFWIFCRFVCKSVSTRCFCKTFLRNTKKKRGNTIKAKNRGKTGIDILSICLEKVFDMDMDVMDFSQEHVRGVFVLRLPRNAQKRTKKMGKKKKVGWWLVARHWWLVAGWWVGLGFSKCAGTGLLSQI